MQKGMLLGIFTVLVFAGFVRQADARCAVCTSTGTTSAEKVLDRGGPVVPRVLVVQCHEYFQISRVPPITAALQLVCRVLQRRE